MDLRRLAALGQFQSRHCQDMRDRSRTGNADNKPASFLDHFQERALIKVARIAQLGLEENHRHLRAQAMPLGQGQELTYLPWAYGNFVFAEGGRTLEPHFKLLLGAAGDAHSVGVISPQPLDRWMRALPYHAQGTLP